MFRTLNQKIKSTLRKPFINILEVGPRDGLQNESKLLSINEKLNFARRLVASGIRDIEIGSLVNYKKVPQMLGTVEVASALRQPTLYHDLYLSVLVPHHSQLKHLPSNVQEIVLFVSASETFNKANINTNVDGAFERFKDIVKAIQDLPTHPNLKIRGSISCCWGCPYEGYIDVSKVSRIVERYNELGVDMIDICDTIGIANPNSTQELLKDLHWVQQSTPYSLHLHDTNGMAVHNALIGISMGIRTIQSSTAGIGGCPFSPQRVGNLDTVKLVSALHRNGYETGINLGKLQETSQWIRQQLTVMPTINL